MVNSLLCQVRVTPHKLEGIEPFTLVNSPPGQVGAVSLHLINTLSGHIRVTPCNSPPTLVNSPPGQIRAVSLHLINSLPYQVRVASSISSLVLSSTLPCVTPVLPLSISAPVPDLFTYGSLPVMSPLCSLSPDTSSALLKTMQATSHEQPVDLPVG